MKFSSVIGFIVLVFLAPLSALLSAAGYQYLWSLTLGAQYGAGPSYPSWYGISLIAHLLMWSLARTPLSDDEKKSPVAATVARVISFYPTMGLSILCALLTRAMLGWQ